MSLKHRYSPQTHPLGHVVEDAEFTVFFGNKNSEPDALNKFFPEYRLVILNQTHSDIVVHSTDDSLTGDRREADAHWTKDPRLALCVRTADCIPVLIFDPTTRLIASAHAGWRGVENEIIHKTCRVLSDRGAKLESSFAWIGPHIRDASFEVGQEVAAKLEARFDAVRGYSEKATSLALHSDPSKSYVNLEVIARAQLRSHGFEPERITELAIDTVQSPEHASYRRDKHSPRRQFSFIALK